MLFLLFQLGNDRYALETSRVAEVLPLMNLTGWPAAPAGVAGWFNYRGRPVPALDLCELALGRPAARQLSTRVVVLNHPDDRGQSYWVGLIVERAREVFHRDPVDFVEAAPRFSAAACLGPVLMDARGPIQWIHERRLIAEPLRRLPLASTTETAYVGM